MACEVQINSINYLQKEGAIDQTNKIVDQELFNNLNDKLTSLAEMKYGLQANGEKLFTTRLSKLLPNNLLFQNFQDKFNAYESQNIDLFQKEMPSIEFMSEDDLRKIMSFDEVESVAGLIMNKLSLKDRPYRMRNRSNIKDDIWYNSEEAVIKDVIRSLMNNIFGQELRIGEYSTVEELFSLLDSKNIPELIDKQLEYINSNDYTFKKGIDDLKNLNEILYRELETITSFIRHKDKNTISNYSKKNQEVIKKYFPSLFKENKFKSDAQAIYLLGKVTPPQKLKPGVYPEHKVVSKIKKQIQSNKEIITMYRFAISSKSKRYKTLANFIKSVPNWKDLVKYKIENQVNRLLEFKNYELQKNPGINKTLLVRKLYKAAQFMTQEFEFKEKDKPLVYSRALIKEIFPDYDQSLMIPATSDTVTVLTNIINLKDGKYTELAKRLLPYAEKHNVPVNVLQKVDGAAGRYNAKIRQLNGKVSYVKEDYILLDGNSTRFKVEPERLILHEIVHSLSTIAIHAESYRIDQIKKRERKDYEKVEKNPYDQFLYYLITEVDKARDKRRGGFGFDLDDIYGFENVDELFAEALTNLEFQELLKQIPAMDSKQFRNLFEQVLDFIRRLFNIEKYSNAYEQLEDVIFATIDFQNDLNIYKDDVLKGIEKDFEKVNNQEVMMMREGSIIQNENSYYRGQIEEPSIDNEGNLILYGKDDPLYKKAGLASLGVSMTDDLKLAIEYGIGQLEGAEKRFEDEWGYDINTWEAQDALSDLINTGYFIIQINKNASNKIVEENNEVKLLGDKIVIPKGQYRIEQVTENQFVPSKDIDTAIYGVDFVSLNVEQLQNQRSKQLAEVLAQRLSRGLDVQYQNVTQEEAADILKNRAVKYNGEPAFYYAGTVYLVGENINPRTVVHEFAHPLLQGLRMTNNILFNSLYNQAIATEEGQGIQYYVATNYPELDQTSDLFKEEVLAYALQLKAINKINDQIETEGFDAFINKLLAAIKKILRGIFGSKVNVSKLDVDTSIEELADMLLEKEFELDIPNNLSEDDLVMFARDVLERAKDLEKYSNAKSLQKMLEQIYDTSKNVLTEVENFKGDSVSKRMLKEAIFQKGTTRYIRDITSSLRGYLDTNVENLNEDEKIEKVLEALKESLEDDLQKAVALVNTLDTTNSMLKNMLDNISQINKSNINSRSTVALLMLYLQNSKAWLKMVEEINQILSMEGGVVDSSNPFYSTLNEIVQNITRVNTNIANLLKNNNIQFYVEITGYMSKYIQDKLKENLGIALKKTFSPAELEREVNDLYNKVVQQKLTDEDIDALVKKGVPKNILEGFLKEYKDLVIDEDKIRAALTGGAHDVSWFNRWLESYSSSNDVIVGPLAMFIQNERTQVENIVWNDSLKFRSKLEKLLPAVGFSKLNSIAMREKMGFKDTVFWVDKETGKPIEKKVWSYYGEFKDYRYHYDLLEFNLEEAKKTEDQAKIAEAQMEFDEFKKDYMWQEFVPEFYEKDDIFKQSEVGKLAYYVRKQKLAAYNNLVNSTDNELERFEEYSSIQAAWREYQQLFSLTYEDGTPKVDDEAKGVYDLSIAKVLIEHRAATKEFYEWRSVEGLLQTAYNEFVDLLATKKILPGSKKYDRKMEQWKRQNLRMEVDPKYWEEKNELITELQEIQQKIKDTGREQYDVGEAYKQIYGIIIGYRDELGEPNASDMGETKLAKIRDLDQEISDFRFNFDQRTGLNKEDAEEFNALSALAVDGKLEEGSPEAKRYFYLLEKVEEIGVPGEDIARMNQIISELGTMQDKLPTVHYMDALNYNLSKLEIKEVTEDKVQDFINSDEFQELLDASESLDEWFFLNHYTQQRWNKKTKSYETYYVRTSANTVKIPSNEDYITFTEIIDKNTGETIRLMGAPGARHSRREVKDEYRTIPFGAKKADYVGKYIDNRNQWLPRLFQPGQKYSAKNGRFMNEEFFQMKASNNAEYKLLEAIKEYHLSNQEGMSNYSKLYLDMPRYAIKKGDIWQAMQKGVYGKRFSELGKNVKEWMKQSFTKSTVDAENDWNYNPENNLVNTNLDGNQITYIPVSGIYNVEIENTDADIFQGLFRYALSIQSQSKLLESLPLVNSILNTLEDPDNAPKEMEKFDKGVWNLKQQLQKAKKKFSSNNRLGQVKSLIEREYYGKMKEGIEETHPLFGKAMQSLQGLSAMGSLAINIQSDLKNKYGGYVQLLIEGLGGEFITLKDFALARPWSEKAMLEWSTKGIYTTGPGSISTQLIQMFDPTFKFKDQFGREVERSMVKDLANLEWMYMHRKFGEMQVSVALFGSFMFGQKVDQILSDGSKKPIRYVEAWQKDEDGIIRLKPGIHPGWSNMPVYHQYQKGETLEQIAKKYYIPVEELKAKNRIKSEVQLEDGQEITIAKSELFMGLKNRIQGTSRKLFGTYDAMGQPEGNKLLLYRMFFFMRKWFTPLFMNRFGMDSKTATWTRGGERYDWATGSYGKGFYIAAFQAMWRTVKSGFRNASYLSTQEKVALRKMAGEGLFVIGLSLLALMIFGFDPEDDDKWNKIKKRSGALNQDTFNTYGFLSNHMLLLLLGVQAESSAFVPLPSVKGLNLGMDDYTKMITQTTSAWYNTVVLYADILGDVLDFVMFSEMDRYKRDVGTASWKEKGDLKIWAKFLKAFGRTGSTEDPEQMMQNMIKSQSGVGR